MQRLDPHDPPRPRRRTDHRQLGSRLSLEWTRLRSRPESIRCASGWGIIEGPIRDLDQILTAVGFETAQTQATERRLRQLVEVAATDDLAAHAVIQRLLPGLLAVAGKRRRLGHGPEALAELLGAAWISIRTFSPSRHPACVAAAIIADADYCAFRADYRRKSTHEEPTDLADRPRSDTPGPHPVEELAELFVMARDAGVEDGELDLLRHLIETPRTDDVAHRLRVTPRTVRNRRARITARIREVALVG